MHIRTTPVTETPDHLRWELGSTWIEALRSGQRWEIKRSWTEESVFVFDAPQVGARLGDAEGVATFARPVTLAPGQRVELWLEWPLEIVLEVHGAVVDTTRLEGRKTILGSVEEGRILPAANCRILDSPEQVRPWFAAIRVHLGNNADTVCILRRCPIAEGHIDLFGRDTTLVAGTMAIRVVESARAEAISRTLTAPEGYTAIPRDATAASRGRFDWLLDSTRRSTEFQL